MRTIKSSATVFLMVCALLFLNEMANAQSIKRQVVASMVSSGSESGAISITVGQPYSTSTFYDAEMSFTPGFQQPLQPGIEEKQEQSSFFVASIHPNPASDIFKVSSQTNEAIVEVKVRSITGQLVYEWTGESLSNNSIDCSNWPTGMYVLVLRDKTGALANSKINIQH